jgi:Xaa-Pro aminopeptidase
MLFHASMEREEAARTGLPTCGYDRFPLDARLKAAEGDMNLAAILLYEDMFRQVGVTEGRVAIFGRTEIGRTFSILSGLQARLPGLSFIGMDKENILMLAMMTKDATELERIRRMGKITTEVVGRTAEFITGHAVEGETLVKADGRPLTIGDVKPRINLWLAELGADNPEGTIFAIGRDAGIPHSTGTATDPIKLGQTIVYDIFPCEPGGGYFYDFTRTWSLGYATDEAQKLYDDVADVFITIMAEFKVNTFFPGYQKRTCELFEAKGHPTVMTNPLTEEGYVHSLGHGVGLNIHERPAAGRGTERDMLVPGSVVTLEPGLYYPNRGMGVRIEDTVYFKDDGTFEVFAPYPYDFVLPMKKK